MNQDITERKRAEQARRESEKRYHSLFENMLEGYAYCKMFFEDGKPQDFIYLDVNEAFERLTGLGSVVGKKATELIPGIRDSNPELLEVYARVALTGNPEKLETHVAFLGIWFSVSVYSTEREHFIAVFDNISERKQAEELLRQAEHRYRRLFEDAPLMYVITRNERGVPFISDCNELFLGSVGHSRDEVVGQPLADFYSPNSREELLERGGYSRALAGEFLIGERQLLTSDGRLIPTLLYTATEVNSSGQVIGTRAMFVDITQRKKAEEALRKSEERLELALRGAELGLWDWQVQTGQGVANRRAAEILGYTLEEIEQTLGFWQSLLHHDDKARALEKVSDHLAGLTDYFEDEYRLRAKSGEWKWILARGKVTERDSDGMPLRMTGTYLDISKRRRAEEALMFEREQLLSIFESINEVILVIDPQTYELLYANRFAISLFGKDLIGKKCYERLNNFDDPCNHCQMDKTLELHGEPHQWEYHSAALNRDYLATDRMIRWPDGRDVKFQLAVDITEHKRAEQEKENLSSQLLQAQKMEAIGTLAGGIAHDFNNLLTVVLGFSELLLIGKDERDPSYADLQKINQAARSGADLVKSILAFGRKTEVNLRPLNLNHEIEQVKKLLTRTIPKMIDIELVLCKDLATVSGDPTQVEQILMNLALNANDAMPDGGKLTIETANVALDEEYSRMHLGAKPGDYVLLSVSDSGHGMGEETLQHIFEPFYTTKETGRGTGLGLAMVHGIVQQHNGYITCHTEAGAGSTFKIYLPVIPTEVESETPAERLIPARGTETILLVDDEELIRDLGKRILERSGYIVLTAANGKDALNVYKEEGNKISLVILDLVMPEMGGKQCFQELLRINPQVKVLLASGYTSGGTLKDDTELSARGFVGKPYDMKQMLQTVREILDLE
ncbi:MAG: PAS domain S-box protein [Desulfomonilaceae bacterium]